METSFTRTGTFSKNMLTNEMRLKVIYCTHNTHLMTFRRKSHLENIPWNYLYQCLMKFYHISNLFENKEIVNDVYNKFQIIFSTV